MKHALPAILLSLTLTGCVVGPKYQRPQTTLPDQFRGTPPAAAGAPALSETNWANLFQDEALGRLVTSALDHNFDLRIAAQRVLEARAQYGITRAELYPTLDLTGGFTTSRSSSVGSSRFIAPGTNLSSSYTQGGFQLGWELDFWGRIRRLSESARAEYLASEEVRHGVMVSLIGDVMNAYFALREQDLQLEIAQRSRDVAQDNLRLIQLRRDRGAANGLEVRQAEQFLYTTTAQIASAQRSIALSEDALNLLLGNAPADVPRGKTLEQIVPAPDLPPGLPASLLVRRPDIREAEQHLIAANAEVGAARALLLPQITLTGFMGAQSRALSNFFTGPARVANIGPGAILPIFRAGLRSGIQLTEARKQELVLTYQKAIYSALRDVSDALAAHDRTREQRTEEEKLVGALSESVRLSELRYRGGLDSYLQVLDAERNLFGGQLTLAQLRLEELQSVVQLYRALGGGWQ